MVDAEASSLLEESATRRWLQERVWSALGGRSLGPVLAPSIVQALVASVQSVSFGLLLLPPSEPAFRAATAVCCTGWMLSVVLGQVAACAASRLPCGVAGGAIEILPLMHAVASNVAQEMRGEADEEVVAAALGAIGLLCVVISVWYAAVERYALHSYLRFFPLSALKGALAGVGIYLLGETWAAVNRDPVQMTTAVFLAVALSGGERVLSGSRLGPWFNALFLVGSALIIWALKRGDPTWFLSVADGAAKPRVWLYWSPRDLPGAPAPWRVRWDVVLGSPATWLCCAGAAFVHQMATMMDLMNLQALGVRPRKRDAFVRLGAAPDSPGVVESEVRTLCLGNLLAGLTLSVPNYLPFSNCYAAHRSLVAGDRAKDDRPPRVEPLAAATLVGLVAAALSLETVASTAPRPVIACYFLWLGALFVEETVVKAAFFERPHPTDLVVVVAMPFFTMTFGFVQALFLGLVIASLSLVARIGSTPAAAAVRSVLNGTVILSNAHREPQHAAYLRAWGDRRLVLVLQGLLNFATAPLILDVAKRELAAAAAVSTALLKRRSGTAQQLLEKPPPLCLVARCALVTALDYSAARAFVELRQACLESDATLLVSELDPAARVVLDRLGFFTEPPGGPALTVRHFDEFLDALDYAEDLHLANFQRARPAIDADSSNERVVQAVLGELVDSPHKQRSSAAHVALLAAAFRRRSYPRGHVVWRAGDDSDALVLVVHGTLKTSRRDSKGKERVIEVVPPLSMVGYLSAFARSPRHVTLVADTDVQLLILRARDVDDIVAKDPAAALLLLRAGISRSADEYDHLVALAAEMAN